MALFKFTKNILEEKPIDVFNYGKHTRDFTYIDDIVEGLIKIIDNTAENNINWNSNLPDSPRVRYHGEFITSEIIIL